MIGNFCQWFFLSWYGFRKIVVIYWLKCFFSKSYVLSQIRILKIAAVYYTVFLHFPECPSYNFTVNLPTIQIFRFAVFRLSIHSSLNIYSKGCWLVFKSQIAKSLIIFYKFYLLLKLCNVVLLLILNFLIQYCYNWFVKFSLEYTLYNSCFLTLP